MFLKPVQHSPTLFWQNIISSSLALTIVLGDRLPQESLRDTGSRFLLVISLCEGKGGLGHTEHMPQPSCLLTPGAAWSSTWASQRSPQRSPRRAHGGHSHSKRQGSCASCCSIFSFLFFVKANQQTPAGLDGVWRSRKLNRKKAPRVAPSTNSARSWRERVQPPHLHELFQVLLTSRLLWWKTRALWGIWSQTLTMSCQSEVSIFKQEPLPQEDLLLKLFVLVWRRLVGQPDVLIPGNLTRDVQSLISHPVAAGGVHL